MGQPGTAVNPFSQINPLTPLESRNSIPGMDYAQMKEEWKKRRKRALALLKRGKTRAEVAQEFGITKQRLHQIIRLESARNG